MHEGKPQQFLPNGVWLQLGFILIIIVFISHLNTPKVRGCNHAWRIIKISRYSKKEKDNGLFITLVPKVFLFFGLL